MLQRFTALLYQPVVIISLIATFIWGITDFSSRFVLNDKDQKLTIGQSIESNVAVRQLSKEQKEKILTLYSKYMVTDEQESQIQENALSLKEQLEQNGVLSEVFVGDNKLELKAVISEKVGTTTILKAMLLITNLKTSETQIKTFINNSQVYGFSLLIQKNTQVTLSRVNELNEQIITLNMYQLIKSEDK